MALFMNSLKHRIAEASGLPKDVLLGQPILTVLGCMEVGIENYRGIIEYTDDLVRLQTKEYYTNDDMKVTGHITSIEYQ